MRPEEENIESLSRAILREAQEDAKQIEAEAIERANAIRDRARQQAEAESKEILDRAHQEAERLRSQVIATAQLKARTLQLEHREKLLDRVFKSAKEKLPGIQKRSDYEKIAIHLLREALLQLNASNAQVRADATTQKVLKNSVLENISKELNSKISMQNGLEEGIGVMVDTADGHLHYDNTLETRLNRLKSELRSSVYQVLMGEKL
jgi:vacuolar-type H+-ATPase subunit E/Vma4